MEDIIQIIRLEYEGPRATPMIFASFSRGGKTRCMEEVARHVQEIDDDVAVIYVTFNDWSYLDEDEQGDPLQALCQRIAFVASQERTGDEHLAVAYKAFRKQNYFVDPDDIEKWIAEHRVILMVDELNLLKELDKSRSFEARRFAKFIKTNFMDQSERYFLFSSHKVSTARKFDTFMPNSISNRGVIPGLCRSLMIYVWLASI
jgi:hypothetical protein